MRKTWLFIGLLYFVSCGDAMSPQDFENQYASLKQQYSQGEYEAVLSGAETLLPKAPSSNDSSLLYYLQYHCKYAQDSLMQGYGMLRRAQATATADTTRIKVVSALMYTLVDQGYYQEAVDYGLESAPLAVSLGHTVLWHDFFLVYWLQSAVMLQEWGLAREIRQQLDDSLISTEHQELVQVLSAVTHLHQGNIVPGISEAQAYLNEYGTDGQEAFLALETIGVALWQMGNLDSAQIILEQAYTLNPQKPQGPWNLMHLHSDRKDKEGVRHWARVLTAYAAEGHSERDLNYIREGHRKRIANTPEGFDRVLREREARYFDEQAALVLNELRAQMNQALAQYTQEEQESQERYLKARLGQSQRMLYIGIGGLGIGLLVAAIFLIWYLRILRVRKEEARSWQELWASSDKLEEFLKHLD